MRYIYIIGLFLILSFTSFSRANAQVSSCDSIVPVFYVDLSGHPDSTWISPLVYRQGLCCGDHGTRCLRFVITLDSSALGIAFNIASGALPSGSMYYKIDCGPEVAVGSPICLNGPGPHELTFCKPGNNENSYSIVSVPNPSVNSVIVSENCSQSINISGIDSTTLTVNSIYPGTFGQYNSYLSCLTGCSDIQVNYQAGGPSYIDFKVCGTATLAECAQDSTYCDTIRAFFVNNLTATASPDSVNLCLGSGSTVLHGSFSGGAAPYLYFWTDGINGTGNIISYDSILTVSTSGDYSFVVRDSRFPGCSEAYDNVKVRYNTAPIITLIPTDILCFGNFTGAIDLSSTGGAAPFGYTWSNGAITEDIANLPIGTYSVTVTDAFGCTATGSASIAQPSTPVSIAIAGSTNVGCFGEATGTIDLTASGGTAPYNYLWSNGAITQDLNNIIAGSYTVTVTDANSCTASVSITISQPSAPLSATISGSTNVGCFGDATGTVDLTASGGTTPYTYLWSNGAITQDINGLIAGNYTVTVTDANNCTASASVNIVQPSAPLSATISGTTNVGCFGDATGAIDLTTNGGTAPYTYLWNNGTTSQDLSNLLAGNYQVTVTDANSCTASVSVNISQPSAPLSASISGSTNVGCFGDATGTVDLTASGGSAPYNYLWSNGAITQDLNNIIAGSYTVTVTDANSCTASLSITISQPSAPLSATISGSTNVGCFGDATGTVDLTASGGTTPYTYLWSNGAITQDINGLIAGNYTVTVTDANNCTVSASVNIVQPSAPLSSTISGTTNVGCFGDATGAIDLTANGGTAPYTYLWSNGTTSQDLSNLLAGNYQVTVTDANSCTASVSVNISQPSAPLSASISGSTNVGCFGEATGTVDLTASGGTAPYNYLWSNGAITQDINNLIAGSYQVTVTDANICITTTSVNISQPSAPLSATISGSVNVGCFGEATGTINLTITGGTAPYIYLWSNGDTTQNLNSLIAGSYQVTVTDANSCTTVTSITITQPFQPLSTSITSITNVLCYGNATGSVDLSVSGGTSPYHYLWSDGSTSEDLANHTAGNYIVTVTDDHNCTTIASATISQPTAPLIATISNSINVACFGNSTGSADLTVTGGTSPYTYLWSNGATSEDLGNIPAGVYSLTTTDAYGCTATTSAPITQPAFPLSATITGSINVGCYGEATGSADLTTNGGTGPYTYIWSNGATSQDLSNVIAGTYSVTVTDANSCTATTSVSISQPSTPLSTSISSNTNVLCCGNSTGSINLSVTGGTMAYTYSWSNGATSEDITNLGAGSYSVTVTDANGCTSSTISVISQPAVVLSATITSIMNVSCYSGATGSANITVSGGTSPYSYLWSNGATSEDLTNVSAGIYTLTATDANGCSTTTSVEISQPSTPLSIAINQSPATCGLNNGSAQATVTGGTPNYNYTWSPNSAGQTTPTINLLNNDVYTVTATDANGCTISSSIVVTRITPPQIEITSATQETCSNANGSITVSVTNGTSPFVYSWSSNPELNTNSLFHVSQGQYTVVVTDHYGCSDTEVITISNHLAQIVQIDSISPAHCNHADGCAFATVEGGSGSYQFHWSSMPQNTSNAACNMPPGSYNLIVSDGVCEVTTSFVISTTSGPSADLTVNRRYALISDASFIFTNLSHDYTSCIWDFGDNTTSTLINPTHVYSEPGTYQVILTVIDEFGCTNTANIEVIVSTELILWIGNSFTPNGDGINDEYGPVATGFSEKGYEFRIYDRWGKEVFFSNDYYHRWDGKINGETITTSFVFSWIILIYDLNGKQYKFKGSVSALGGE